MRGVAIDNINQQVMTAGADCKLKVNWQLFMLNVCVYFGSKLNFFTRIRISSKMMQRKPSCDENSLEQHQFWRYLSTFSTLFSPSSQNNYVLSHLNKDVRNLCPMFEFKPETVPISSSNAELHGIGFCARSCKGSISNHF